MVAINKQAVVTPAAAAKLLRIYASLLLNAHHMGLIFTQSTKIDKLKDAMYLIFWRYKVKKKSNKSFEIFYGENGRLAEVFKKSESYFGAVLYKDDREEDIYFVIELWESNSKYNLFVTGFKDDYVMTRNDCKNLCDSSEKFNIDTEREYR